MYLVSPSPSKRRPDPQRNQMLAGLVVQVARSEARKCTVRRVDWRAIHHNTERIVSAIEHVVHHGLDVVRLSRLIETAQLCGDVICPISLRLFRARVPLGDDERHAVSGLAIRRQIEARTSTVGADVEDIAVDFVIVPGRDGSGANRRSGRGVSYS
jgi:hypothetical protein